MVRDRGEGVGRSTTMSTICREDVILGECELVSWKDSIREGDGVGFIEREMVAVREEERNQDKRGRGSRRDG